MPAYATQSAPKQAQGNPQQQKQPKQEAPKGLAALPQGAGVAALVVMLALALPIGNFRALQNATPQAFIRQGDVKSIVEDRISAAQNAVIAAEALGPGSCYIGDVVENAEEVAALLDLPPYTMPLSMLIIGTPRKERPAIAHPVVNLVHEERYRRADAATMDTQVAEMDAMFRPHAREVGERVVDIYTRKHTSPFMAEMSRSMEWWFKNWLGK